MATILVLAVVVLLAALAVRHVIRNKRKGRTACGCEGCAMCAGHTERGCPAKNAHSRTPHRTFLRR